MFIKEAMYGCVSVLVSYFVCSSDESEFGRAEVSKRSRFFLNQIFCERFDTDKALMVDYTIYNG